MIIKRTYLTPDFAMLRNIMKFHQLSWNMSHLILFPLTHVINLSQKKVISNFKKGKGYNTLQILEQKGHIQLLPDILTTRVQQVIWKSNILSPN